LVPLFAWCVGSRASRLLELHGTGEVGSVEHIFPSSFYLKTKTGDLISVTTKRVRSPVNINVEERGEPFPSLLSPGEGATLVGGRLAVGPLAISLGEGRYSNSDVASLFDLQGFSKLSDHLLASATLLQAFNLQGSMVDETSPAFTQYRAFFRENFIRPPGFSSPTFMRNAVGLLGLGSGFTPSFDDFLSGFLCLYNLASSRLGFEPMRLDPLEVESRTSWASAKLVEHMQEGEMDEDVEALVASAFRGDGDAFVLSVEEVVGRGHSSGLDLSCGLVMAAAVVQDMLTAKGLASTVAGRLGF